MTADAVLNDRILKAIEESEAWIPEIGKGTGWRPEEDDSRDFRLKSLLGSTLPPPMSKLLVPHVPPVRDQYTQGACTGGATANGVGTLVRKNSAWDTIYSMQFPYNLARLAINELHLDEGAYLRDAVGSVRKIGIARESDFPYYNLQDIQFDPPPVKAIESARSWRLGAHYRCATLNDVKRALASGYPVVFGFVCHSNMNTADVWRTGLIPLPGGSVTGGHAVMAASYDDASRVVRGPNTWSRWWGDKGWYGLPYAFFERGLVSDAWALVDESPDTKFPLKGRILG